MIIASRVHRSPLTLSSSLTTIIMATVPATISYVGGVSATFGVPSNLGSAVTTSLVGCMHNTSYNGRLLTFDNKRSFSSGVTSGCVVMPSVDYAPLLSTQFSFMHRRITHTHTHTHTHARTHARTASTLTRPSCTCPHLHTHNTHIVCRPSCMFTHHA